MPLNTTDFSPIMQRIKNSGADTIFTFLPAVSADAWFCEGLYRQWSQGRRREADFDR
jgi:hypothetical protein